jgi:hypothetical protein
MKMAHSLTSDLIIKGRLTAPEVVNLLEIKYARIVGEEALLSKITMPLAYNPINETYSITLTDETLLHLVQTARDRGINVELKSI